jgi:hypothetical protein
MTGHRHSTADLATFLTRPKTQMQYPSVPILSSSLFRIGARQGYYRINLGHARGVQSCQRKVVAAPQGQPEICSCVSRSIRVRGTPMALATLPADRLRGSMNSVLRISPG